MLTEHKINCELKGTKTALLGAPTTPTTSRDKMDETRSPYDT